MNVRRRSGKMDGVGGDLRGGNARNSVIPDRIPAVTQAKPIKNSLVAPPKATRYTKVRNTVSG
jgi:hypothetical protein